MNHRNLTARALAAQSADPPRVWPDEGPATWTPRPTRPEITADDLRTHVYQLAADSMAGRAAGTRGNFVATSYIASIFQRLGLRPAGDNGGWFQNVPVEGALPEFPARNVIAILPGSDPALRGQYVLVGAHNDHEGNPVPSRHASREELLALCAVAGEYPGTSLEFIPEVGEFDDETFELMGTMSRVANRPLNWNVLFVYAKNRETVEHQLAGNDLAAAAGGGVCPTTVQCQNDVYATGECVGSTGSTHNRSRSYALNSFAQSLYAAKHAVLSSTSAIGSPRRFGP